MFLTLISRYSYISITHVLLHSILKMHLCNEESVHQLPLPTRLKNSVLALFSPTIRGYIPDPDKLREFVSSAPPNHERLHCTMIRTGQSQSL